MGLGVSWGSGGTADSRGCLHVDIRHVVRLKSRWLALHPVHFQVGRVVGGVESEDSTRESDPGGLRIWKSRPWPARR